MNIILIVLVHAWILSINFLHHGMMLLISFETETPTLQIKLLIIGLKFAALWIPLLILARVWPHPVYQNVYRTWLLAASSIILFFPAALFEPASHQAQSVFLISALSIFLLLIFWIERNRRNLWVDGMKDTLPDGAVVSTNYRDSVAGLMSIVLVTCAAYTLPWLTWGALGSLLDTVFQVLLGFLFAVAGYLLFQSQPAWTLSAGKLSGKWWQPYLLGGITYSTAFLLLMSALPFPFGSMQIILMVESYLLGWLLSGLRFWFVPDHRKPGPSSTKRYRFIPSGSSWFMLILCWRVLAMPLLMFDPDELGLYLGVSLEEILRYAFQSMLLGSLVLIISSIIVLLMIILATKIPIERQSGSNGFRKNLFILFLLLTLIFANLNVYLKHGQVGFFGERLFVIFKSQADLQAIDPLLSVTDRREAVYNLLVQQALTTQKPLLDELDSIGIKYKSYYLVNAIEIPENPFLRLWLLTRPEVDRILPSPRLRPLPESLTVLTPSAPQDPPKSPPQNITQIHADQVWREFGITGEGLLIGIADSGVQEDHQNFASRYRGLERGNEYSWLDPWYGSSSPVDPNGHGTHTLGTILGQYTGVAPGAGWIACANLPRNLGNPALYLDCWQFLFAPHPAQGNPFTDGKPDLGAHIISNSWGCPPIEGCDSLTFLPAVEALRTAGVFQVVSAGNEGPSCTSIKFPPSHYEQVFSVGAIDERGDLAPFSSLGPVIEDFGNWIKPDLVAPGVRVLSSLPGSDYGFNSGTSMSAPHVAGTVALIWSANPALIGNLDATENILHRSAKRYQGNLPDCQGASDFPSTASGYGILDAYAAVLLALDSIK